MLVLPGRCGFSGLVDDNNLYEWDVMIIGYVRLTNALVTFGNSAIFFRMQATRHNLVCPHHCLHSLPRMLIMSSPCCIGARPVTLTAGRLAANGFFLQY